MPNSSKKKADAIVTTNELYEMAEEFHIDIDDFRLKTVKSMSQMSADGSCSIALDSSRFRSQKEERATLSHELGHCLTGSFYNRHTPYDIRGKHEHRANKKATYILVPFDELIAAVGGPWNSIHELSERFDVPESFMRRALEIYEQDLRAAFARGGK